MVGFLLIIGLLFLGTAEYTHSIGDAVLSILMDIQQNSLNQEWPDILFLILMLAIPFFIFYLIYYFFIKSMLEYSRFIEKKTKTNGFIKSVKQTGIYIDEHPEVKIVVDAFDEKKRPFTVEIKEIMGSLDRHLYQKGSPITILYNPKNPHEAVMDKSSEQETLESYSGER